MLHISTCYVAGARQGQVAEALHENYAPLDDGFDVEQELGDAMQAIERICAAEQSPEARDVVDREVHALIRERRSGHNEKLALNLTQRRLRERLRDALSREGCTVRRRCICPCGWG
jgi:2-polyprenyl-6-methoxyphenol hydroxylase-like FAD-dependent oxidoreductase